MSESNARQVRIASAVKNAIRSHRRAAFQAPHWAENPSVASPPSPASPRAVVATSSIALQDQLVDKAHPFVASTLEERRRVLCGMKEQEQLPLLLGLPDLEKQDRPSTPAAPHPAMIEDGTDEKPL